MKKSQSSPALRQQGMSPPNINSLNSTSVKKSTSTTTLTALNAMNIENYEHSFNQSSIDLVFITTTPINKLISCSFDYNKFPDEILNVNDDDLGYIACIETPPEPPSEPEEKVNIESTLSKSYLQLSIDNAEKQEKYMNWIRRLRRNKKKNRKSIIDKSIDLFQSMDMFQSMDTFKSIDATLSIEDSDSINK